MISKEYIKQNMVVSMVRFFNLKTKFPVFYIASAVPVNIRWKDNKVETIDLLERIEIPMNILTRFKFLMGKVLDSKEAEKYVTSEMLNQLINKSFYNISEREDLGYLPDRKTGDNKYFKKIYEVKKRSGKI